MMTHAIPTPRQVALTLLVLGMLSGPLTANTGNVRIIQTNAGGDNATLIDPATMKVVGTVTIGEVPHGVSAAPDGSRLYFTSEADHTVDVVDVKSMKMTKKIPLSGVPNNITITPDGRRVYAGIAEGPGAVDIIDTASLQRVKTIATPGGIHNLYATPDGKYVVAGSNRRNNITVINTKTEEPEWMLFFDGPVRPFTFQTNADGSTKNILLQIGTYHGFYVVDFQQRREIARVPLPDLPQDKRFQPGDPGIPAHGLLVAPDGKTVWSNSNRNRHAYAFSLPDYKLLGGVAVGSGPLWLTFTPDSKFVYVANTSEDSVSVIDVATRKEVTRIPVGRAPKRNISAVLAASSTSN